MTKLEKISWTKEMESLLSEVLQRGGTARTAVEILQNKLNVTTTRNAVIGKASRMGLEFKTVKNKNIVLEMTSGENTMGFNLSRFMDLWNANHSQRAIAKILGVAEKTITKKIRELKIPKREVIKKSFTYSGDGKKEAPVTFNRVEFPNPEARKLAFMDVPANGCRFIIGNDKAKDFLFCGAKVPAGSDVPYCEYCRPIVYVKPAIKINRLVRGVNIQ